MNIKILLFIIATYTYFVQCGGLFSSLRSTFGRSYSSVLNLRSVLNGGDRSIATDSLTHVQILEKDLSDCSTPQDLLACAKRKLPIVEAYIEEKPALGLAFAAKSLLVSAEAVGLVIVSAFGAGLGAAIIKQHPEFFFPASSVLLAYISPAFKVGCAIGGYNCICGTTRADEPSDELIKAQEFYQRIVANPDGMFRYIQRHGADDDYRGNICSRMTGLLPHVVREHLRKKDLSDMFPEEIK